MTSLVGHKGTQGVYDKRVPVVTGGGTSKILGGQSVTNHGLIRRVWEGRGVPPLRGPG